MHRGVGRLGLRRLVVSEHRVGGAILACLDEAEHLAVVGAHRAADLDHRRNVLGRRVGFEMGGRSRLADRDVGGVAEHDDVGALLAVHVQRVAVGRDPAVLAEPVLLDHFHALVRGNGDQKIVREVRAFFAAHPGVLAVDFLQIEERLGLDPHPRKFAGRPFADVLEAVQTADRIGVIELGLVEQAAVGEKIIHRHGDFERDHRALVRQPDGDQNASALERAQLFEERERARLGVAIDGVLGEAGNELRHRARSRRDDDQVVFVRLAALGDDVIGLEIERFDRVDVERNAGLEQARLFAIQLIGSHAPHRDIEEPRLVHVPVRGRQHRDRDFAGFQFVVDSAGKIVGENGACHSAADDENSHDRTSR